jgi:hypothetical protein
MLLVGVNKADIVRMNVALRRVRASVVLFSISFTCCECLCNVSYPGCNAHAPYCHLWPVRLLSIFPHYHINGTIFEKKNNNH